MNGAARRQNSNIYPCDINVVAVYPLVRTWFLDVDLARREMVLVDKQAQFYE